MFNYFFLLASWKPANPQSESFHVRNCCFKSQWKEPVERNHQQNNSVIPLSLLPILSTSHFVYFPFCPLPTLSTSHFVHFPLCLLPILSNSNFVHFPFCLLPTLSTSHFVYSCILCENIFLIQIVNYFLGK